MASFFAGLSTPLCRAPPESVAATHDDLEFMRGNAEEMSMDFLTNRPATLRWVGAAALLLLAFGVYWPSLNGPFLWDDKDWTTEREWLLRDWKGLWLIWSQPMSMQQYYPLTSTSFWLDYQWWGFNTLPYHVENVLLHGLACILFWAVLRQLGLGGAWIAAALFAVHPVMVESVAWITERKNVLCQFLILAALLAYGRFNHRWTKDGGPRAWTWWWASFFLFTTALLAKVTAFIFPPALLVITWWKMGRVNLRRDVLPVLPMFGLAIVVGLGVAWMETHHVGAKGEDFDMSFIERLLVAGQALWFYLGKLIWPHPICAIYHRWELDTGHAWQWLGVAAAAVTAAVIGWQNWRGKWRGAAAAALLYGGMLFPVIGFMNLYGMRFAWVADRWVYMAALVVFAGMGQAFNALPGWKIRIALAAVAISVCGVLTWHQAACYRSVDFFWQAIIECNPNPWKAHNDYSDALMSEGRDEEAVEQLREAVRLQPDYADAHCNLGIALLMLGRIDESLSAYRRSLELRPDEPITYYNMAAALEAKGQIDEVEKSLLTALDLRQDFLAAHNDLGNLYFKLGRVDEAEKHYRAAYAIRPRNPNALTSLGNVAYRRQRLTEALDYYRQALEIDPDLISALANGAFILSSTENKELYDLPAALDMAERAARASHFEAPDILMVLATTYAKSARFPEAAEAARKGLHAAETKGNAQLAGFFRRAQQAYERGQTPQ